MDKVRSFYIEVLRIVAATYVFIYHVGSETSGNKLSFSTPDFNRGLGLHYNSAHYFVIVFFVLSGFLITMSASKVNLTMREFLIIRLGRLYSVLIPSLLFSYFVTYILINFCSVPIHDIANSTNLFGRFILNILYLAQSWTLSSTPPLNAPFWSIDYEFIYYLLLGCAILMSGKKRILLIILILLVVGLKVLLLFPAWLTGSLLHYVSLKYLLPFKISLVMFFITLILIIVTFINPFIIPFTKLSYDKYLLGWNLFYSWNYIADYLFSLLVGFNLFCAFGISKKVLPLLEGKFSNNIYNLTRKVGNCTYTLYLFHLPLLFLYSSIFPYDKTNVANQIVLIVAVTLSVFVIAKYTEWRVDLWRSLVSYQFGKVSQLKRFLLIKVRKS
jgi:peptidoglycan/LPS O-acetylase OafA/YrhL